MHAPKYKFQRHAPPRSPIRPMPAAGAPRAYRRRSDVPSPIELRSRTGDAAKWSAPSLPQIVPVDPLCRRCRPLSSVNRKRHEADAVAARLGSFRSAPEGRQSDVSQARHIALAGTRGGNDPLRHDLLHDGQLAGVVKFFASGHSEHQQKYLCRCCYCYAAIEPGCVCAGAL